LIARRVFVCISWGAKMLTGSVMTINYGRNKLMIARHEAGTR
jgi:hypothetical protein